MRIKNLDPKESKGSILARSYNLSERRLSKGTHVSDSIVELLNRENVKTVLCAIPHKGDMHEDTAAEAISKAIDKNQLYSEGASTGRVNFRVSTLSIVRYNRDTIKKINLIDESIAFSIVQHNQLLAKNDLIATLKIIPFFLPKKYVEKVIELLSKNDLFTVHQLEEKSVSLIQTFFKWQKKSIFKATSNVTRGRLANLGVRINKETLIAHDRNKICAEIRSSIESGSEVILISGASAIMDRSDCIPDAIISEGGKIIQYGLAVDPGNLLLIGQVGSVIILGMPGCARSPKLNGFDWVLQLIMANIPINKEELADMGAGGLLMEIASRPLPRTLARSVSKVEKKIMGIVLAAGCSNRMGNENKLLKKLDKTPLVRRVVMEMLNSDIDFCSVVLGYESDKIADAISDLNTKLILNPKWRDGQSSSLRAAIRNLDDTFTDVLIMLSDLPKVTSSHLNKLIEEHLLTDNRKTKITIPSFRGAMGNPVIWGKSFFQDLSELNGDVGGRVLFDQHPAALNIVEMPDNSVAFDVDTPHDFKVWKAGVS